MFRGLQEQLNIMEEDKKNTKERLSLSEIMVSQVH